MTQDNLSLKPSNYLAFLLLLTAISLANGWGLYLLYQQHQDDKQQLKKTLTLKLLDASDLKSQMNASIERQAAASHDIVKIQQSLAQITRQQHDNVLLRIDWLLHQAQWQLNILKQMRYSKAYLHQAKKIALSSDLHQVADAIHQDLMRLKQVAVTPLDHILSDMMTLKQQLDDLNPVPIKATVPVIFEPEQSSTMTSVINLFKPFIKIEHYHETPAKFLSADDQRIIIQNLELLLSETQYAAISSQATLFKQLVSMFEQEAQVLDAYPSLRTSIIKLKASQLQLPPIIHLTSLSMVQELLQAKSAS